MLHNKCKDGVALGREAEGPRRFSGWALLITLLAAPGLLRAQLDPVASYDSLPNKRGFFIQGGSAYIDRYWSSNVNSSSLFSYQQVIPGSGTAYGFSAAAGWTLGGEKSHLSFVYTPSYNGNSQFPDLNRLNHAFSLFGNRPFKAQLSRRWSLDASATANITSFDAYFFEPSRLAKASAVSGTYDDLTSGVLGHNFTNDALGAALTSSATADSPLVPIFFGYRFFTASVQTNLTYAYSSRLRFQFSGLGMRGQALQTQVQTSDPSVGTQIGGVPQSTSATGTFGISYSTSPRTNIGFAIATSRSFNGGGFYSSNGMATFSRSMSRRWFTELHAGAAISYATSSGYLTIASRPVYIGGATLGFKTYRHNFLGMVDRTVSNAYGTASINMRTTGAWTFHDPGRSWSVTASISQERFQNNMPSDIKGYSGNVTVGRLIGRQTYLQLSYVLVNYRGLLGLNKYDATIGMARFGISWMPHLTRPQPH